MLSILWLRPKIRVFTPIVGQGLADDGQKGFDRTATFSGLEV